MKTQFEKDLLSRRIDFMLAHTDISWLSIGCRTVTIGKDVGLEWNVSCAVHTINPPSLDALGDESGTKHPDTYTKGELAHIHNCNDLGWALEEAHRRACWNLATGAKS